MNFGMIYAQGRRMVVVHHTHAIPDLVDRLKSGDLVFFDDCLYSQYVFLDKNLETLREMNIVCVLGLSPKAMRLDDSEGIYAVGSSILHENLNRDVRYASDEPSGDYINGFMSEKEVKTLLKLDNVFLALHGCCHLDLSKTTKRLDQPRIFAKDLDDGIEMLSRMGLETDIFVFPYAYEPFLGLKTLKSRGFRYIFAGERSKRLPIEELTP